jgi:hypothetical protein
MPSQGVPGGFASRSGGLADLRVSRRFIPSAWPGGAKKEAGVPAPFNNRGDGARLLSYPSPERGGWPAERIAKAGRVGFSIR